MFSESHVSRSPSRPSRRPAVRFQPTRNIDTGNSLHLSRQLHRLCIHPLSTSVVSTIHITTIKTIVLICREAAGYEKGVQAHVDGQLWDAERSARKLRDRFAFHRVPQPAFTRPTVAPTLDTAQAVNSLIRDREKKKEEIQTSLGLPSMGSFRE